VCDIDGVVLKGTGKQPTLIGNSKKLMRVILGPVSAKNPAHLPFIFLTNGGTYLEQTKVDGLNTLFELGQSEQKLNLDHVIVCHTVFGSPEIQAEYKAKTVLVDCGADDSTTIPLTE